VKGEERTRRERREGRHFCSPRSQGKKSIIAAERSGRGGDSLEKETPGKGRKYTSSKGSSKWGDHFLKAGGEKKPSEIRKGFNQKGWRGGLESSQI